MSTETIYGVEVHEGECNTVGAVKEWEYTIDGNKMKAKERAEHIDDKNMKITYTIFGGEVNENFKSLKAILQVIDKGDVGIVKWVYEYEKVSEDIPGSIPESYIELAHNVTKEMDAYLVKA